MQLFFTMALNDSMKSTLIKSRQERALLQYVDYSDKVPDSVKMNQLQNLIHDTLISTDHVQSCAIVNRADASVKASSVGFSLFSDQVIALIEAFKSPSQTREEGIYFNDKQYKCVRADKFSIYAKDGNKGLVVIKTATLLLVATYTEVMKPSICVEAVEKLAEYFREKGK